MERVTRADGTDPFCEGQSPSEQELAEWRIWATTVFIPNIQAMRDVIVSKADLLIEEQMPPVLLELCAHVSGYEISAARWSAGHYDEWLSVLSFPGEELRRYVRDRFARLKGDQARLLGKPNLSGERIRRRLTPPGTTSSDP